jgi:hypothetical protein
MPERVIKIILPENEGINALALLREQENLTFWQEESYGENFVASALTDSGHSEIIMDRFEKRFSTIPGFKLILFPVEASIPRMNKDKEKGLANTAKSRSPSRISREELYADIIESTKLSSIFLLMTFLSTVVVAIGLEKNNVAVIIGAMVIAPFLGPNVALALSTNLSDRKLGFMR